MRLLLVEDDAMIGDAVRASLQEAAYAVDWVRTAKDAEHSIACQQYDLILLDLGLPGGDGMTLLRDLRSTRNPLPVVIMTARDSVNDRIQGLDAGADDYLVKPFATGELLARMRAVLRRKGGSANPIMSNGAISLDPTTREAQVGANAPVLLSNREFALLRALIQRPGAILSRAELEERIYGWGEEVESNVVEYLIHGLRKKLGAEAIKNIRGLGWMVAKGE